MQRIGVLTGGGDAPGLNAVLRAIVLTACRVHGFEVVGIRDGFEGLVKAGGTVNLDESAVRGLLWRGGSILGCNNSYRGDPKLFARRIRELNLDGLLVVGGDGSLTIGAMLAEEGVPVVGVPKTIDNDVVGTDITFGYNSALDVVTDACHRLIGTAESHHRVMIVEVMGRNSGFIALNGAIAGGADVALLPEIPFGVDNIRRVIQGRSERQRTYTIIIAAEGAKPAGGDVVTQGHDDKVRLGGIGDWLASELRGQVDHEVRALSLGHLQRGGPPTPFDRILGTRMGHAAVHAMAAGRTGVFTGFCDMEIRLVPISVAAGKSRKVPADGPAVACARETGIAFGDR